MERGTKRRSIVSSDDTSDTSVITAAASSITQSATATATTATAVSVTAIANATAAQDALELMRVQSKKKRRIEDESKNDVTGVRLSRVLSAAKLKISDGGLSVSGCRGYRSARTVQGVVKGTYYYEIDVKKHSGNVRVGWCTRNADVEAPIGYDRFGYSYRDKHGTVFHRARGSRYGEPYTCGDTIGCLIHLPDPLGNAEFKDEVSTLLATSSHISPEDRVLPNSYMSFYKNGKPQGVAFKVLFNGPYFAAAALFQDAHITFNFGPDFKYPPSDLKEGDYEPLSCVVKDEVADTSTDSTTSDKANCDTTAAAAAAAAAAVV
jgi:SPRY domain